jgi:hypothetical protein
MSVILECQPGDTFYCLQTFHASPDGEGFSWNTAHEFRVGERLRYVSHRQSPNYKNRPNSWLVIFEAADGKRYAATQTYFVTAEAWEELKKYFGQRHPRKLPAAPPHAVTIKKPPTTVSSKKRRSA